MVFNLSIFREFRKFIFRKWAIEFSNSIGDKLKFQERSSKILFLNVTMVNNGKNIV